MASNNLYVGLGIDDSAFFTSLHKDFNDFTKITKMMETAGQIELKVKAASTQKIVSDFKTTIEKINKLKGTIGTYNNNTPLQVFSFSDIAKGNISDIKKTIKMLNSNLSSVKVKGGINNDVKQTIELLQKAVDLAAAFRNETNKLSMVTAKGKDSQVASRIKDYERFDNTITKLKANLKDVGAGSSLSDLQKQLSQLNKIANTQRSADASLKTDIYAQETLAIEKEIAKVNELIFAKKKEQETRKLDRLSETYKKAEQKGDLRWMLSAKSREVSVYENIYNKRGEASAKIMADKAKEELAVIQKRIEAKKQENKELDKAISLETKAKQIEDTISETGDKSIADLRKRVSLSNQLVETYKQLQQLTGIDYSEAIQRAKNVVKPDDVQYSRDADNIKGRITNATENDNLKELRKAQLEYARLNERRFGATGNEAYLQEARNARAAAKATQELIQSKQKELEVEARRLKAKNKLEFAEQDYQNTVRRNAGKNVAQYNSEIMALQKLIAAKRQYLLSTGKSTSEVLGNRELQNMQESLLLLRRQKDELLAHNRAYSVQKSLLKSLHNLATRYFGIYAIINFAKKLAETVGYFEQQKVALKSITQDAQKANTIFRQLQGFSVKSPFQFKELVSFTKQLSAFQIPTDELFDTTKRLADISAGLGVDMQRIILAYGQVRSASVLRGQELRQFTEAGIPLVDELAKRFSVLEGRIVSTSEVFKRISERQVSFEMVKEILFSMTEEGGRFNEMQEKLSQTTYGQIMNLKDAWMIALNDIGNANSGIINSILKLFRAMIDNWRTTLSTALGLLSGVAINVAIGKITKQAAALEKQLHGIKDVFNVIKTSAKQAGLSIKSALWSTGIGALLAAFGFLVGRIIETIHKAGELKREFKEIDGNATEKISSLVTNFNKLTNALKATAEGSEEERKIYEKLLATYSEYLPKQDLELQNLRNLTDGYNQLTSAIIAKVRAQAEEDKRNAVYEKVGKDIDEAASVKNIKYVLNDKYNYKVAPEDETILRLLSDELKETLTNNISLPEDELRTLVKNVFDKYLPEWKYTYYPTARIVDQATKKRNKNAQYFGLEEDNTQAYKSAIEQGYSFGSEDFNNYVNLYQRLQKQRRDTQTAVRDEIKTSGTSISINGQKTADKTRLRQLRDAELYEGAMKELELLTGKKFEIQNVKGDIESGRIGREAIVSSVGNYISDEKGNFTDPAIVSLLEDISTNLEKSLTFYEQYESNVNGYLDNLAKTGKIDNGLSSLYNRFYMSPQTDLSEYVKSLQTQYNEYKSHYDQQLEKDPKKIKDRTLSQKVSEDVSGMAYLKEIAALLNIDLDSQKRSGGGGSTVTIQSELSDFINSLKKAYETYRNATQKGGVEMGLGYVRNDKQVQEMFGQFFGGSNSDAFKKLDNVKIGNKSVSTMIQDKFITDGLENGILDFESAAKSVAKELKAYYEDDKKHRTAFKNASNELIKWIESTIAKDNLNSALKELEKNIKELSNTFDENNKKIELYRKLIQNGTDKTVGNGLGVTRDDVIRPESTRQKENIRSMVSKYNEQLAVVSNGKGSPYEIGSLKSIDDIYKAINQLGELRKMNGDNFEATSLGQTTDTLENLLKQLISVLQKEYEALSGKKYTGNKMSDTVANANIQYGADKTTLETAEANAADKGTFDYDAIKTFVESSQNSANAIYEQFLKSNQFDVLADSGFGKAKIDIEPLKAKFEELISSLEPGLQTLLKNKFTDLEMSVQEYNSSIGAFGSFGEAFRTYRNADEIAKNKYNDTVAAGESLGGTYNAETNSFSLDGITDPEKIAQLTVINQDLDDMGKNGSKLSKELKEASLKNMQQSAAKAQQTVGDVANAVTSVVSAAKTLISTFNKVYDVMNDGENPAWMQDAEDFLGDFGDMFSQLIMPITAVISMIASLTVAITTCETAAAPLIAMTVVLIALAAVVSALVAAFQQHDRALEHDIEGLDKKIEDFDNAIKNLNDTAERQAGLEKLQTQIEAVGLSLEKSSAYAAQAAKEEAKKNTDEDKLKEYQQKQTEAMNEFKNSLKSMFDEITASTDSWASAIGDAIRSAFQNGENAARAFRSTVKTMIGDVVDNMIQMAIIEPLVNEALENWTNKEALQKKYTYNVWDEKTKSTLQKLDYEGYLSEVLNNIGDTKKVEEFKKMMDLIGDTVIDTVDNMDSTLKDPYAYSSETSALSGGIESITEDTARRLEALYNSQLGEIVLIRTILQNYMMSGFGSNPITDIQNAVVQMNSNVALLVSISNMIQNHIYEMRNTSVLPLHVTMV